MTASRGGAAVRRWSVLAIVVLMSAALMALLLYGLLGRPTQSTLSDSLRRGEAVAMPDFELDVLMRGELPPAFAATVTPALADGKLSPRELRGTPMLINVWASWCGPCRDESPALRAAWHEGARSKVLVLGLNQQDVRAGARRFAREEGLTYPSVRDPTDDTAKELGATGVPETFAVDARGRIVGHRAGAITPDVALTLMRAASSGRITR